MNARFSAVLVIGLIASPIGLIAQQGVANPAPGTTTAPAPAQEPAVQSPRLPTLGPEIAPSQATQPSPAVATPAAITTPPAGPAPNTDGYVVGPDDNISVNVWKEPSLSGSFPVRPDGMISLALVGDVVAAGRTPMELANDLTAKLKKYVTDPTVTVTVLAVNSKRIFMLGEVAHIGALPLTSSMSPLQAIAAAGGLSPYANKSHIYILRGEQGKQKKIPFDYKKAIKDGDMQGITLLPGDTIVVP